MNNITPNEIPVNFSLCCVSDCPVASHCLRRLAFDVLTQEPEYLTIVNPHRTLPSEACEYYRSDELQDFARGFAKMQEEMLPRQYKTFMTRLQGHFGRTGYFERRRGERLCSPQEIAIVREVLGEMGLSHLDFDGYEQHRNWYG